MATKTEFEIVLYDLACTKNICFSPAVWRTRLILNYKQIPYTTVFLEFPDIAPTMEKLGIKPAESKYPYTVPVIHYIPTNTYMMDSVPIAQCLETTYPEPPLTLASELGRKVEAQTRGVSAGVYDRSLMPRETGILSPRSQEYFRRTREPALGHPVEQLDLEKEEQDWKAADSEIRAVSELIQTNKAEGPFVLGAKPSFTDFFLAGALQCGRMIHEETFQRYIQYPGFKDVYEACLPYMEKKD